MVGTSGLLGEVGGSHLSLARPLRLEGFFVSVVLGLITHEDLVLRCGRIHVIQFPFVRHRRNLGFGQGGEVLLLPGRRDRFGSKTRLREQHFLLRCGGAAIGRACCLASCH